MQSFLAWTFRLYRAFGIDVRVHWMLPVFMLFEILNWLKDSHGPAATWNGMHPASYAGLLMGLLFLSVLIHEYGHCIAARMLNAGADEIILWPLGGLSMVGHAPDNRGDTLIAFAGPAVGLLAGALCLGLGAILGESIDWDWLNPFSPWGRSLWADTLKMNITINLANLIAPVYPLDGGRILTGLLTPSFGYARALMFTATTGILFGIVIIGGGLYFRSLLAFLTGLFVVVQCVAARMQIKSGILPEYAQDFAESLDARTPPVQRLGFFARWRMRREGRRRQRQQERERRLREQVDSILEKLHREGMNALTPHERHALNEASKWFRDLEG